MAFLKIFILFFLICSLRSADNFPFYSQCDAQWGSIRLSWFKTMCQSGSLFTSIASLIKGYNQTLIDSTETTPKNLLDWLDSKGYSTSFYDWKSIIGLGFEYYGFQNKDEIIKSINNGFVGVVYVPGKDLWHLCHSIDENKGFIVHDSVKGEKAEIPFGDVLYGGVYKFIKK